MAVANSFVKFNLRQKNNKGIFIKTTITDITRQLKTLISQENLNLLSNDGQRFRIFDPFITLSCFLHQAFTDSSCKQSLVNFNINRLKEGKKATSLSTAAYCRAKSRLSKKSLIKIAIVLVAK